MDVSITLSGDYIQSPDVIKSIEPDNDGSITVEYREDCYVVNIKNVKLGSIASLCMDLLESIEISRKMWDERI